MKLSAGTKNLFPGVFLILVTVQAPLAQQDSVGRQLIDDFVNNVQTMSGRFEQQLVDADDIVIDQSSGTIEIQKVIIARRIGISRTRERAAATPSTAGVSGV